MAMLVMIMMTMAGAVARQFTLVIDAGHGGHDAGAKGAFSYEKNINLKTALAFGRYVEKNCPDVKVIYTRKTDVFIPLHKRADIANKNKADIFISIHTNALPGGKIARGLETYTMGMRRSNEKLSAAQRENAVITYESDYKQQYEGYDPNSPESAIMFEFIHDKNMAKSVELAKLVQKNVCATAGRPDKGVRQDVFLVLRETSMPACLIELGFITTPDEERLLNDEQSVDNIARGIYNAFAKYKNDNFSDITVPFEAANTEGKAKMPELFPTSNDKEQATIKRAAPRNTTPSIAHTTEAAKTLKPKTAETAVKRQDASAKKPDMAVKAEEAQKKTVEAQKKTVEAKTAIVDEQLPVFKVQIIANQSRLARNSKMLKGQTDTDHFMEDGMYKYTVGASNDYNAINRLRQQLNEKFPGCFVIAFKNGKKMNINTAIRDFKNRKKK